MRWGAPGRAKGTRRRPGVAPMYSCRTCLGWTVFSISSNGSPGEHAIIPGPDPDDRGTSASTELEAGRFSSFINQKTRHEPDGLEAAFDRSRASNKIHRNFAPRRLLVVEDDPRPAF